MVDVKGKLVEVSNRPFIPFFKNNVQVAPIGHISTLESEDVNVDEEEADEDEVRDTNLLWYINGLFEEEET
jgi:hypothetical protein